MMQSNCTAVDPNPDSPCNAAYSSYGFQPALWTGILFCCLFGIELIVHCGLLAYHRLFPRFMFIAVVGAAGELAGWIARTYGHTTPSTATATSPKSSASSSAQHHQCGQLRRPPERHGRLRIQVVAHPAQVVRPRLLRRRLLLSRRPSRGRCAVGGSRDRGCRQSGKSIMIAGVSIQVAVTAPFLLLYLDYNLRRLREWSKAGIPKHERPYPKVEIFNGVIGNQHALCAHPMHLPYCRDGRRLGRLSGHHRGLL